MEYLWHSGALSVCHRKGFRKHYDLTERVIPEALLAHVPSEAETIHWCCGAALDRLGFATSGELAKFWRHVTMAEARDWCESALARGEIEPITWEDAEGTVRRAFARPGLRDDPALDRAPPARLRVLSPFDPALRDRTRAKRLFGFDYTIEIFVPEAKRRYGYYVFPMLEGTRIVGRVDMKADRAADRIAVKALWPEAGTRWGKGRSAAFYAELARLQRLAGVSGDARFAEGWLRAPD